MKTFTVSGKLAFPIDMLRYDACFPQGPDDVAAIEASINRERDANGRRPRRDIALVTTSPTAPTSARWSSFLWTVTIGV